MNPSPATPQVQRRFWIGPWLLAVAALHTLFALLVFKQPLAAF